MVRRLILRRTKFACSNCRCADLRCGFTFQIMTRRQLLVRERSINNILCWIKDQKFGYSIFVNFISNNSPGMAVVLQYERYLVSAEDL